MKKFIPLVLLAGLCFAAFPEDTKSDIVAVYNADSVQQGNEVCRKEHNAAQEQFERSKHPSKAEKQTQEHLEHNPKTKEAVKSKSKGENPGLDPKSRQKQITKDSIYLYDSVPVICARRIPKIAEDFRKTYGYKYIMTREEFATYKKTSNGAMAKSENVTRELTKYANVDSVALKHWEPR